jgi:hypothetical protein
LVTASKPQCQSQYARNTTNCDANPSSDAATQRTTITKPSNSPLNIAQLCDGLNTDPVAQNKTACFPGSKAEFANCGKKHY